MSTSVEEPRCLHLDREGRVYIAFADGCTEECATKADRKPEDSRDRLGAVAILATGPSMRAEVPDFTGF